MATGHPWLHEPQLLNQDPLTPIERFWLAEDVPGSWLSFFHKYTLDHDVITTDVLRALQATSQGHPLPFCQVEVGADGQPCWQASKFALHRLVRERSPEPYRDVSPIQIDREPGLRVWCCDRTIWFEYHHGCADGRGALTLEREFFARYAHGQLETSLVPTQRGSLASLSTRSRARITLRGGVLRIIFGPSYLWKGFNTDVLPFPDAIPAQGPGVAMGIESHALTPGATERVKAHAKGLKVSLNDLVLAEMARLIALQNPPPIRGSRVLRLVVPVDMRVKHGRLSTCANKMSFVYLDVPLGRVTGSPAFARWISKRMKFLKRYMGMIVWRTIQFGPKQIAGLRAYLQRQAQLLTCYVSNLGVVSGFPTCVRSFEATPTLRRDTPLALMVYTFRGRLQLTVGFDTRRVTRRHARACMLQVAGQLQGKPPAGS